MLGLMMMEMILTGRKRNLWAFYFLFQELNKNSNLFLVMVVE